MIADYEYEYESEDEGIQHLGDSDMVQDNQDYQIIINR
jgi:hypothetical protein